MANAALQRKNMVESQIRPSDVTDRRITAAMASVAREPFLPPKLADLAYSDESLTIAPGREVLPPRVLAKLIQLAEIDAGDRVLVISEAGYAAALVAQFVAKVISLLPDEESAATARQALSKAGLENVTVAVGAAASGWPDGAPYDVIIVEGGVEQVPDALKAQMQDGGRLVAIATDGGIGRAVEFHKRGGVLARREGFQAAAPTLAGFREIKPAFVF
jgi:protein-L-isoaspartate(D-aspartate) O-methyltransferase